jgi:hypothetical protein
MDNTAADTRLTAAMETFIAALPPVNVSSRCVESDEARPTSPTGKDYADAAADDIAPVTYAARREPPPDADTGASAPGA